MIYVVLKMLFVKRNLAACANSNDKDHFANLRSLSLIVDNRTDPSLHSLFAIPQGAGIHDIRHISLKQQNWQVHCYVLWTDFSLFKQFNTSDTYFDLQFCTSPSKRSLIYEAFQKLFYKTRVRPEVECATAV